MNLTNLAPLPTIPNTRRPRIGARRGERRFLDGVRQLLSHELPGYNYLPDRELEADNSASVCAPDRPDVYRITPVESSMADERFAA